MPEWRAVDEGKLDSALNAPKQSFVNESGEVEEMYPTLEQKTAVLVYSLAKAHALPNGNKRIALVATFLFCAANGKWWADESEKVRAHMTWLAASEASARAEVLAYMTAYLRRQLVDFREHMAAQGIDVDEVARQTASEAEGEAAGNLTSEA
jgi:prophage maintenance system killer protein